MKAKKILTLVMSFAMMFTTLIACVGGDVDSSSDTTERTSVFTQEADYSDRNGVKREWNKVSSYFINYGEFQEEMLRYDVAIIGRNAMTEADIQKFKDAGVWTVEYITLGEDYSLNIGDGMGPGGYASYYLYDDNDQPIPNGDWGSYYVDPANPAWRTIVFNEIRRIIDSGVDGIFMDTVDCIDAYPQTFNGMCNLIKDIREEFPDIKMVLNRGFTAVPTVYEYLDGVMFELFSTYYNLSVFKYDVLDESSVTFSYNRYNGVQIVNACRQKKYFPVFAMEYYPADGFESDKQLIYDRDWEYDFIPYINAAGRTIGGEMMPYEFRPKSIRGKKALAIRDDVNLKQNGDLAEANLAYEKNGAKVTVDSLFNGYNKNVLIDGYISNAENFESLGWQFANWASGENENPHYVIIELPAAKDLSVMKVHWAFDNGDVFSSRSVEVQVERKGEWVKVGEALNIENGTYRTDISLKGANGVTKVRLYQEAGNGPVARRNLMWISEIELYA